jgi:hypothetical protein
VWYQQGAIAVAVIGSLIMLLAAALALPGHALESESQARLLAALVVVVTVSGLYDWMRRRRSAGAPSPVFC